MLAVKGRVLVLLAFFEVMVDGFHQYLIKAILEMACSDYLPAELDQEGNE